MGKKKKIERTNHDMKTLLFIKIRALKPKCPYYHYFADIVECIIMYQPLLLFCLQNTETELHLSLGATFTAEEYFKV